VLAVDRAGATTPNPGPDFVLEVGDRVLAFGGPAALSRVKEVLEAPPAGGSER
jgi:K+/H+ antiporter YhaU regulatory subunit KhtT